MSATLQHQVKIVAQDGAFAGIARQVFDVDSPLAADLKVMELTWGKSEEEIEDLGIVRGVKVTNEDGESVFVPNSNEQIYIDEELDEMTANEAFEEFVGPVSEFLRASVSA